MEKENGMLFMCGGCSHKIKREGLRANEFYCRKVDGIIPHGIVTDTTDATECVQNNWYEKNE
ncbi:MAG: hypothetical protein J6Y04_10540 [Bacteroidaceae bacterium]|nr:hypothetical protein [Bacteroidaceae bacterium]